MRFFLSYPHYRFNSGQLERLEEAFSDTQYPDLGNREKIARDIGLSESCVQVRLGSTRFTRFTRV